MIRSPFASLPTNLADPKYRAPSSAGIWTGRVAYVHRDTRGRLSFLFDIIPLSGWPAPTENVGGGATLNRNASLRGIPRVRLLHPFIGNLRNPSHSPTGIIVVPEVGSIVSVAPDEAGWVIIGFHSGPTVNNNGSSGELAEYSYNPGLEEAESRLVNDSGIPWLLGIEEGDIILGKGDSRIKLRAEGVFIGSNLSCMHVYKSNGGELLERYAEMERRAIGRSSYHRYLPGVTARQTASIPTAPVNDALVINTDIIESSPYLSSNKPYVVRQVGHIPRTVIELGRKAGEVLPLPTEITTETLKGDYSVIRETVIAPKIAPTNTAADASELQKTSALKFDYQVGADGSFHIRAGNAITLPGASILRESSPLDFELSYNAQTKTFKVGLEKGGKSFALIELNGVDGSVNLESASTLHLKAPKVIIDSDVSTEINSNGFLDLSASGPMTIDAQNISVDEAGTLTALKDVMAGFISLLLHTHISSSPGSPTSAPAT